ncbi:MAG: DNA cytosine methyltransferase, partial [Thermomicrobiales bacterium]
MGKYAVKLQRSAPLELPRHSDAKSDEDFAEWCDGELRRGQRLAVDLFSGAGGLGFGVEKAGWTVVMSVDHDVRALETHRANFAGIALHADMSDPRQVEDVIQ